MIRGRLRRHGRHERSAEAGEAGGDYIEIDPGELRGIFSVPGWLRDIGMTAWMLVGVGVLIGGLIALLGLTQVIVFPVIVASVVAAVASPLVAWLNSHRVPRALGTVIVLLAIVAIVIGMTIVVITGITGQSSGITTQLDSAKDTIAGWLQDIGLDPAKADAAKADAATGIKNSADALLNGLATSISRLSSLAFFLALTAPQPFLPALRRTEDPRLGDRAHGRAAGCRPGDHAASARVTAGLLPRGHDRGRLQRHRGHDRGADPGSATGRDDRCRHLHRGFVPYLGAWAAAGFAVLIALGNAGPEAALGMIVVELLANGILQQLVQPFAMGAALGIHPLAVLIVTIGGGALFGMVGLVLAAPITSAVVRISADLAKVKAKAEAEAGSREPPLSAEPAPG